MKKLFFIMMPFFILLGFIFVIFGLILINQNLSLFLQWDLFNSSSKISFIMYMDYMSSMFMGLVLIISGSIIFYSDFYMYKDMNILRFFYLMMFFVISMIFLILCPNFICMLIGWDGLGLVSYCLVIFYHNFKSFNAGMITALTNRIGDVFILGSISLMFCMGSWSYMNFFNLINLYWISLFFMIAAMTKSAQIPFSAWLPAAMAAPTPVSSLVHSSTLVTAGVYILIRFNYLFYKTNLGTFLIYISLMTMIMSGISGIMENDLKKIIALSTLSQLGFMMSTLSLGFYDLTFFHLLTHACFKALLFMCSGILIHNFSDNQDIRGFGVLNKNYSLVLCMFNISNLSLAGFPFLSGFFSKDLILELMIMKEMNFLIFVFFILGTFLTVFYSFRLMFYLILKQPFFFNSVQFNLKNLKINKSMFILFFFSIMFGFLGSKLVFLPYNFIVIPIFLKYIVLFVCLLGAWLSYFYSKTPYKFLMKKNILFFFGLMWFLFYLKTDFLKKIVLKVSSLGIKLSSNWIEFIYGKKFISGLFFISMKLNYLMTKFIYFIFFSFFMFFLMSWLFLL